MKKYLHRPIIIQLDGLIFRLRARHIICSPERRQDMSEDTIAGFIIAGLWAVFMVVLIIVNKKRRAVTGEVAEHHQIGVGFGRDVGKDMDLPGGIGHRKNKF